MVATTLPPTTLRDAEPPPGSATHPGRCARMPRHGANAVAGLMLASLLSLPLWGLVYVVVRLAVA